MDRNAKICFKADIRFNSAAPFHKHVVVRNATPSTEPAGRLVGSAGITFRGTASRESGRCARPGAGEQSMSEMSATRKAALWVGVVFLLGAALGGVIGYSYQHHLVSAASTPLPEP